MSIAIYVHIVAHCGIATPQDNTVINFTVAVGGVIDYGLQGTVRRQPFTLLFSLESICPIILSSYV